MTTALLLRLLKRHWPTLIAVAIAACLTWYVGSLRTNAADLRTDLATAEGQVTTLTERLDRATASAAQWRIVAESCQEGVDALKETARSRASELVELTAERDRLRLAQRRERRETTERLETQRTERYAAMTRAEACEAAWLDLYTLLEGDHGQP